MKNKTKFCMVGASGKMGKAIIALSQTDFFKDKIELAWALESPNSKYLNTNAHFNENNINYNIIVNIQSDAEKVFSEIKEYNENISVGVGGNSGDGVGVGVGGNSGASVGVGGNRGGVDKSVDVGENSGTSDGDKSISVGENSGTSDGDGVCVGVGGNSGGGDKSVDVGEKNCVIIDFSSSSNTLNLLKLAKKYNIPYVIGSTGFTKKELDEIKDISDYIPIMQATNMSLGVTLLLSLVQKAAEILGPNDFDIEISEIHHHHKKDSPSGTALSLNEAVRKSEYYKNTKDINGRVGLIGERSGSSNEIGMHAIRGGDVVGDHTVYFFGDGERLELTHKASSRNTFAKGALKAAIFLSKNNLESKQFNMKDVLGL